MPQYSQTRSTVRRIAEGFGVAAVEVDRTSFDAIYADLPPPIAQLRAGGGPVLVEAKVVRIDSHSNSGDQKKYRAEESILRASLNDPILIAERDLAANGILSAAQILEFREEIRKEVNAAADYADARPFPTTETQSLEYGRGVEFSSARRQAIATRNLVFFELKEPAGWGTGGFMESSGFRVY